MISTFWDTFGWRVREKLNRLTWNIYINRLSTVNNSELNIQTENENKYILIDMKMMAVVHSVSFERVMCFVPDCVRTYFHEPNFATIHHLIQNLISRSGHCFGTPHLCLTQCLTSTMINSFSFFTLPQNMLKRRPAKAKNSIFHYVAVPRLYENILLCSVWNCNTATRIVTLKFSMHVHISFLVSFCLMLSNEQHLVCFGFYYRIQYTIRVYRIIQIGNSLAQLLTAIQ